jgi:hypothetical protein
VAFDQLFWPFFLAIVSMDPLTALSLAGTIVQFVDFGTKLLSESRGLYKSSSGALDANIELELITSDLYALITKLRFSSSVKDSNSLITANEHEDQVGLETICDHAAKVAEQLLGRLNDLKLKGGKHRKWESFQQAVKSAWSKEEITGLATRLSSFRQALDTQVLISIR